MTGKASIRTMASPVIRHASQTDATDGSPHRSQDWRIEGGIPGSASLRSFSMA